MEIWQACPAETEQIGFFLFSPLLQSERSPEEEEATGIEVVPYKGALVKFTLQGKQYCGGVIFSCAVAGMTI